MIHKHAYRVFDVANLDELVEKLTPRGRTWCGCNGFRLGGLLFLNDSFGADGAQEYAVINEAASVQVESLTVSWMTPDEFRACVTALLDGLPAPVSADVGDAIATKSIGGLTTALGGKDDGFRLPVEINIDKARPHRCGLCA